MKFKGWFSLNMNLQILDWLLTYISFVYMGAVRDNNPVVQSILDNYGWAGLLIAKIGYIGIILIVYHYGFEKKYGHWPYVAVAILYILVCIQNFSYVIGRPII